MAYMDANDEDGVPEPKWLKLLGTFVDTLRRNTALTLVILTHLEAQEWLEQAWTEPK
jgi:hypothetical protein